MDSQITMSQNFTPCLSPKRLRQCSFSMSSLIAVPLAIVILGSLMIASEVKGANIRASVEDDERGVNNNESRIKNKQQEQLIGRRHLGRQEDRQKDRQNDRFKEKLGDQIHPGAGNSPHIFNHNPDFDPKLYESPWTHPLQASKMPRPIRILAFGGSVTWGATLENRHTQAYPWLLGGDLSVDYVDNEAMRATGADYPSLCLESIIHGAEGSSASPGTRKGDGSNGQDEQEKNYDVILFDFVLNGTDGFPLLLERLSERFPEAIIVYVHIWSILRMAKDKDTHQNAIQAQFDLTRNWVWKSNDTFGLGHNTCPREVCSSQVMEQLVRDAGGYVWKMPLPETPSIALEKGWFSSDWHHLSAVGHEMVATKLLTEVLSPIRDQIFKAPKALGSFGLGDQCYNWFQSGDLSNVSYEHAHTHDLLAKVRMNFGDPDYKKVTLEIDSVLGGSLTFQSRYNQPVPLGLAYMSIAQPEDYPVVSVTITSKEDGSNGAHTTQGPVRIDPSENMSGTAAHVTVYSQIGVAHPGQNTLHISPAEPDPVSGQPKPNPFRVIGIYLCGHCVANNGGDMGHGALTALEMKQTEEKQEEHESG
jgi:hypothetical protein